MIQNKRLTPTSNAMLEFISHFLFLIFPLIFSVTLSQQQEVDKEIEKRESVKEREKVRDEDYTVKAYQKSKEK